MELTLTLFQTQPCLVQPVQPRSVPYSSLGLRVQLAASLLSFSCEKQLQGVEVNEEFWSHNSTVENSPLAIKLRFIGLHYRALRDGSIKES